MKLEVEHLRRQSGTRYCPLVSGRSAPHPETWVTTPNMERTPPPPAGPSLKEHISCAVGYWPGNCRLPLRGRSCHVQENSNAALQRFAFDDSASHSRSAGQEDGRDVYQRSGVARHGSACGEVRL